METLKISYCQNTLIGCAFVGACDARDVEQLMITFDLTSFNFFEKTFQVEQLWEHAMLDHLVYNQETKMVVNRTSCKVIFLFCTILHSLS